MIYNLGKSLGYPLINSISAKSYNQNGLVAMWDGIENAGWGVHDASATTWKDLGGNFDLPLPSSFSVGRDYISPSTKVGAILRRPQSVYDAIVAGGGYTIEVVRDASEASDGIMATIGNENQISIFQHSRASCVSSNKYGGTGTNQTLMYSLIVDSSVRNVWSVCVTLGQLTVLYRNSVANNHMNAGGIAGLQYPQYVGLGVNSSYPGVNNGAPGCRYHCVRLYSRSLTSDEIAHNYAIDKIRFNLP